MVRSDRDRAGRETGDRPAKMLVGDQAVRPQDELRPTPRREIAERVVEDVETLDVPRVAFLQPFRQVHHDAEQGDELGRQKHRRGDQEDPGGVEGRVARGAHGVGVRRGGTGGKDAERQPAGGGAVQADDQRSRDTDGAERDRERVRAAPTGAAPASAVPPWCSCRSRARCSLGKALILLISYPRFRAGRMPPPIEDVTAAGGLFSSPIWGRHG